MNGNRKGGLSRRFVVVALAIDIAALSVFFLRMQEMRRPFEILMLLLVVLGVLTAVALRNNTLRGACLIVASMGAALFLVEMSEKFFNVTALLASKSEPWIIGKGGPYSWPVDQPTRYFDARDRAVAAGVDTEALRDRLVGEIFPDAERKDLIRSHRMTGAVEAATEGYKKFYLTNTNLGYEHTPDNLVREYGRAPESGRFYFDVSYAIDRFGLRETRGAADADEAYVFLGCSFTFGAFLNADETLPHGFSQATGFEKRVLNLGVMGWGPHQALRALELDRFVGPALQDGTAVKGVVFSLIDTHIDRAANTTPKYMDEPFYVLEGDTVRFVERRSGGGFLSRLSTMMDKSRVYPVLRDRLLAKYSDGAGYKWRLTVAILAEMNRLCLERYGTPLTVVYWDDNAEAVGMIRKRGIELIPVREAFEDGDAWKAMAIKYLVFDGHPSAHANRRLADHLAAHFGHGGGR